MDQRADDLEQDEFERTMVIPPSAAQVASARERAVAAGAASEAAVSAAASGQAVAATATGSQPAAAQLPSARLQVLSGTFAGRELQLAKALTTLGRPGVQVAAITRRSDGFYIVHVEGRNADDYPLLNGQPTGAQARKLSDNDVIQLAGVKMGFFTD